MPDTSKKLLSIKLILKKASRKLINNKSNLKLLVLKLTIVEDKNNIKIYLKKLISKLIKIKAYK